MGKIQSDQSAALLDSTVRQTAELPPLSEMLQWRPTCRDSNHLLSIR